jgi:hypothetical protein
MRSNAVSAITFLQYPLEPLQRRHGKHKEVSRLHLLLP